jgi:N-methylhydantoinase B
LEQVTHDSICKLPSGTYHSTSKFNVLGGEIIELKTAVTIDANKGEISINFAGSSP